MSEHYDVVIVGGAVIGSAAAYFLQAESAFRGTVLVLDRDFGYTECATTRSAASIRHQFSIAQNVRMSMFGTKFLRQAHQLLAVDGEGPAIGFHEGGYLFLARDAGRDVLECNHRVQRTEGVDVVLLDPSALTQRFPWLAVDDLAAGSLGLSGEGWLDAHALMHGFRRKAIASGAIYREAAVAGLERDGQRVSHVRLADGTRISGGTVINAAGTGATALAATAGIALPVESRKRCVFHFRTPAALPDCPLVIDPSGLYFRPEGAGFICGIAPPETDDPHCTDFEVPHAWWDDVLWPGLAARVPGFEAARMMSAWAGHYDVNTFDHNVILGAHPDVRNLLFANGFSGHGLQQSPAVGRALAELVAFGEFRTLDLSAFGWQRVLDGQPLLELNIV